MRCLDLFAGGCNGFGLAAQWMGWETVACVEIDKWNQKLLRKNFPEAEIYGDIREFNEREAAKYRGRIDLITGGFPCQPFSTAGKREGTNDDRYLWPQMLETIRIIQPPFVIGENVAGLTSMEDGRTFDNILASLEDEGYTVESFILPACSVGAWHRRDRLWIVAYHFSKKWEKRLSIRKKKGFSTPRDLFENNLWNGNRPYIKNESIFLRDTDGLPNWTHRIKALGNAVVPQIPYEIYKAIESTFL